MRWSLLSSLKFYASAGIALVGVSAASTLLTNRPSMAQAQVAETRTLGATAGGGFQVQADQAATDAARLEQQAKITAEKARAQRDIAAQGEKTRNDELVAEAMARFIEQAGQQRGQQSVITAQMLAQKLAELQVELDLSLQKLGRNHPKVLELQRTINAINRRPDVRTVNISGDEGVVASVSPSGVVTSRLSTDDGMTTSRAVVVRDATGDDVGEVQLETGEGVAYFAQDAKPSSKLAKELRNQVEKLKSKELTADAKADIEKKIAEILSQQFDTDMDQRGKQIAELEKKVATLKEQVDKRRAAKQRLIDLRIEMLKNESEGLGFPNAWQQPTSGIQFSTVTDSLRAVSGEPARVYGGGGTRRGGGPGVPDPAFMDAHFGPGPGVSGRTINRSSLNPPVPPAAAAPNPPLPPASPGDVLPAAPAAPVAPRATASSGDVLQAAPISPAVPAAPAAPSASATSPNPF